METVRVYAACPLDLNATRRAAEYAKSLRRNAMAKGWEAAFVPPPSLHVTLRWLGEVDLGLVSPLSDAIAAVAHAHGPFRVHVGGLVAAGDPASPTQLGLKVSAELLQPLADDLAARLAALGLDPAPQGFRAWLPLARVTRAATPLGDIATGSADVGVSTLHEVVLYRADSPRADVEPPSLARFALAPQAHKPPAPGGPRQ